MSVIPCFKIFDLVVLLEFKKSFHRCDMVTVERGLGVHVVEAERGDAGESHKFPMKSTPEIRMMLSHHGQSRHVRHAGKQRF